MGDIRVQACSMTAPVLPDAQGGRFTDGLQWSYLAYFAAIHTGALALCPWFWSWPAFWVATACYVVTGFGITVGYHRLLAHPGFSCPPWVERAFALLGVLAGEGPPLFWVVNHRKHHKYSDTGRDPHSPLSSFAWAHILWLFPKQQPADLGRDYARWAPKMARDSFYRGLESHYLWVQALFALALFAGGFAAGSWTLAFSVLAYAYFLRMVLVLHATWLVNSLGHTHGHRRYPTQDQSRNNLFVALVALGEGWHNNHHYMPVAANHGHRWWEFDVSFLVILLLATLSRPFGWAGLAHLRPVTAVRVYRMRTARLETWFS
jgi:stearoyl-CoA desaturase (delta-9 desaturase)